MLDSDFVPPGQAKDTAIPRFFVKQVKNNFKTEQQGHPVYDPKEYVEILIPGDSRSVVVRAVSVEDKGRWPTQYAAFKNNLEYVPEGMPLEQWTMVDVGMVEHLRNFNVRTVEQVSQLSDSALQQIGMGARELQVKAKVWLAQAKDGSALSRLVQECQAQKNQIETLQQQVAQLVAGGAVPASDPAPDAGGGAMAAILKRLEDMDRKLAAQATPAPDETAKRPRSRPRREPEAPAEEDGGI